MDTASIEGHLQAIAASAAEAAATALRRMQESVPEPYYCPASGGAGGRNEYKLATYRARLAAQPAWAQVYRDLVPIVEALRKVPAVGQDQ